MSDPCFSCLTSLLALIVESFTMLDYLKKNMFKALIVKTRYIKIALTSPSSSFIDAPVKGGWLQATDFALR